MRLLHLYFDLMNLYGEYANISALNRYLTQQGITTETDRLSLYETIDFETYDLIYMGSGTEYAQELALKDLMKQRACLKKAYDDGTVILATGNAFELFGKSITKANGETLDALSFFDFSTKIEDDRRMVTDQLCRFTANNVSAVGFINKSSVITGISEPMFIVEHGTGNQPDDWKEGILSGHFYGTHLTGPCLVKNPFLAEYFVRLLCDKAERPFVGLDAEYENKAYEMTLSELRNRKW